MFLVGAEYFFIVDDMWIDNSTQLIVTPKKIVKDYEDWWDNL